MFLGKIKINAIFWILFLLAMEIGAFGFFFCKIKHHIIILVSVAVAKVLAQI